MQDIGGNNSVYIECFKTAPALLEGWTVVIYKDNTTEYEVVKLLQYVGKQYYIVSTESGQSSRGLKFHPEDNDSHCHWELNTLEYGEPVSVLYQKTKYDAIIAQDVEDNSGSQSIKVTFVADGRSCPVQLTDKRHEKLNINHLPPWTGKSEFVRGDRVIVQDYGGEQVEGTISFVQRGVKGVAWYSVAYDDVETHGQGQSCKVDRLALRDSWYDETVTIGYYRKSNDGKYSDNYTAVSSVRWLLLQGKEITVWCSDPRKANSTFVRHQGWKVTITGFGKERGMVNVTDSNTGMSWSCKLCKDQTQKLGCGAVDECHWAVEQQLCKDLGKEHSDHPMFMRLVANRKPWTRGTGRFQCCIEFISSHWGQIFEIATLVQEFGICPVPTKLHSKALASRQRMFWTTAKEPMLPDPKINRQRFFKSLGMDNPPGWFPTTDEALYAAVTTKSAFNHKEIVDIQRKVQQQIAQELPVDKKNIRDGLLIPTNDNNKLRNPSQTDLLKLMELWDYEQHIGVLQVDYPLADAHRYLGEAWNGEQTRAVLTDALSQCNPDHRIFVLDLFSGVGTAMWVALPMLKGCQVTWISVEIDNEKACNQLSIAQQAVGNLSALDYASFNNIDQTKTSMRPDKIGSLNDPGSNINAWIADILKKHKVLQLNTILLAAPPCNDCSGNNRRAKGTDGDFSQLIHPMRQWMEAIDRNWMFTN